jgi:putative hemolysin
LVSAVLVDVVVVLIFVLIGGFFAAAEIALVSLRESQVQRLAEVSRRGRRLKTLTNNPNRYLAAVQVGVTLAGFVSAGFGASQIAPSVAVPLEELGLTVGVAETVAFIGVTIVIAFFSLVLGELVPKRIALQRVEKVALFVAVPIDFIATVFKPFIVALSVTTNGIVRIFGIDPNASRDQITGEELRDLVASHEDLTVEERELIDDVFAAGDRELREVMVPRTEAEFLPAALPVFKASRLVADMPHSRYPVMRDSSDDVVGFVHIRDLLDPDMSDRGIRVGELAREIVSFPGTKNVMSTLTEMRRLSAHLAIVQDEYGGTAGIVTMEDLVEELIGDIKDEYDVKPGADHSPVIIGEVTVDGLLNIEDFHDETGIELPDGPYETVAGFLIARLEDLPKVGEGTEFSGYSFTVAELDGLRASRVTVRRLPEPTVTQDEIAELTE